MKTVLIVDDEALFLASLTEGLAVYGDEFQVITANNGRQAVEAFDAGTNEIALVVTDLKMPVMDGFQLLAYMMSAHPKTPIIVMTAFGTPEIEDCISDFEAYGYLEKPIDFQLLADTIRAGINPEESTENFTGIKIFSFLQLLNSERKTCFLTVKSEGRRGTLYFSEGELLDATYNAMTGDAAAEEIMGWQNAEIKIANMFIKVRRRVEKTFRQLYVKTVQRNSVLQNFNHSDNELLEIIEALPHNLNPKPIENPQSSNQQTFKNLVEPNGNQAVEKVEALQLNSQQKTQKNKKEITLKMANNVQESLGELMQIDGAMAVALVDARSGMALGTVGSGVNLEVAAAGNSEVVKAKLKVMGNLGLKDKIEDILISLTSQYHLIRPLTNQPTLFFYIVLNRTTANLAMARFKLSDIEGKVEV